MSSYLSVYDILSNYMLNKLICLYMFNMSNDIFHIWAEGLLRKLFNSSLNSIDIILLRIISDIC